MCSALDDMTSPVNADAHSGCQWTSQGFRHSPECDARNGGFRFDGASGNTFKDITVAPAEVWCSKCDQPSVDYFGSEAFCVPHLLEAALLDAATFIYNATNFSPEARAYVTGYIEPALVAARR